MLQPKHFGSAVYLPYALLLCANSSCQCSQWGFVFSSPYSAPAHTVPVSLSLDKECLLFQSSFNFIPFCCYTSGQKSVIEPRVVLACKNRPLQILQQCFEEGIKSQVSAGPAGLGELQAGLRPCGDQGLLPLLGAEGSRSWCSHFLSGCSNSAEAHTSREPKLLLMTASPRQQILPGTWSEARGTCEHLSSRSRSQTCSCTIQWFPLCTNWAGGQSCCYHKETVTRIS